MLLAEKVGILPELAVELVLQDQLNREKIMMVVRVGSYKTRRREESKKSITINGVKLLGHDPSTIFKNQKEIKRALLEACMDCDKEAFVDILSGWVRTHNILEVCRRTGLSRTMVYEAISGGGKPSLDTFFKIMALFKKAP